MELSEEQAKKIEMDLHLHEGAIIVCPICGEIDWNLNPNIFEYPDWQNIENRSPMPNRVFPVIILCCEKCNYCISFSAVNLGLVAPGPVRNQHHEEIEENIEKHSWSDAKFLKWINKGTRNDKLILLLSYLLIFTGGIEVGSNLTYPIILSQLIIIEPSKLIGWLFSFFGVLFLGLSAYLIDIGSKNPLIDVTPHGSISIATSTKRTEKLQRNKKKHEYGMAALILGLVFSAAGLILTLPVKFN